MNKGIFVTGTDTGVGKTLVACAIAHLVKSWGVNVGVMKPFATGDQEDAKRLIRASGVNDDLSLVNPEFFREALAPTVAAEVEGREMSMERVYKAFWALSKRHDAMIVEGVGGVKVPLGESTFVVDLIESLRLPALVVARPGLGTLNHTLLTLDALASKKIPIVGVLLSGGRGTSLAEKTNPEVLQDHTTAQILGHLKGNMRFEKNPSATAEALEQLPLVVKAIKRECAA